MSSVLERLREVLSPRYEVEVELGAGGMGTVYLARDTVLDRKVALKVLRPEEASATAAQRLLSEARILASFSHPNVVSIHDAGELDESFYYVMDFVDGETLEDRLKGGPLAVEVVLQLGDDLLAALEAAHERGVVHRDVKPSNIFLVGNRALLGDFGIAKRIETEATGLTAPGDRVGTPGYMAPEQAAGDDITPTTDIYAVGLVLYQALTGRRWSIIKTDSVDWSGVPRRLARTLQRALMWTPEARWPDAASFRRALGRDVRAASGRRILTRRRALVVGALASVALLILALWSWGTSAGLLMRAEAAAFFSARDQVVVAEFENETDEPGMALAVREAIVTDLDQSDYVNVVQHAQLGEVLARMRLPDTTRVDAAVALDVARREGYPAVVSGSVAPLGSGYLLTAQIVEVSTGEVAVRLRETAADAGEVIEAVERLTHLTRRHLGESLSSVRRSRPLPEVTTASLDALQLYARSQEFFVRGNYEPAIHLLLEAVELDTAFASAYRALSIFYGNIGNPTLAQFYTDRAYGYSDRLFPAERYRTGALYHALRGRTDSAAHYYRRVLDFKLDDPTSLNNLGDAYERMGRYEEALRLYRRVAEVSGSSTSLFNLASGARTLGDHALADSALALISARYGNTWHEWATMAMNAYYAEDFERLEQIARDMAVSRFPFPRAYGRWLLASTHAMHGKISAALALADTSVDAAEESGSEDFGFQVLRVGVLAAFAAGTPERAQRLIQRARDPASLEAAPLAQYYAFGSLAVAHALAGDLSETRRILESMDSLTSAKGLRALWLGEHVRAIIALAENRPEASLEHLRQARAAAFGMHHHASRLLLGDAYVALGRLSEAAVQYDSLTSTYGLNFSDYATYGPLLPLAHERLGSVHLALGDTASAVRHLAAFVELWSDADAELRPRVESAKRTLSHIIGEGS